MESLITGFIIGSVFSSVIGFKAGSLVEKFKTEKEHIVLTAQNEAYEKILQVSNIRREIK